MKPKNLLPLTKELIKQAVINENAPKSISDYIAEKKAFELLGPRDQETSETLHRLRQIENLLLMIWEKL